MKYKEIYGDLVKMAKEELQNLDITIVKYSKQ